MQHKLPPITNLNIDQCIDLLYLFIVYIRKRKFIFILLTPINKSIREDFNVDFKRRSVKPIMNSRIMVGIIRIDNTNKSTFNGTHLRYELCANEGAFGEHGEQNSIMGQS